VNDRLKAALLLPTSRKFIVMAIVAAIAAANKKLDLGIPPESIYAIAAVAAFVVLGIAHEDAARAKAGVDLEMAKALRPADFKEEQKP
jgi:hypothetical protein